MTQAEFDSLKPGDWVHWTTFNWVFKIVQRHCAGWSVVEPDGTPYSITSPHLHSRDKMAIDACLTSHTSGTS